MEAQDGKFICPKCSKNIINYFVNEQKIASFSVWQSKFYYIKKIYTKKWLFGKYLRSDKTYLCSTMTEKDGTVKWQRCGNDYIVDLYTWRNHKNEKYDETMGKGVSEFWKETRGSTEDEWNKNARFECENCGWDDQSFFEFIKK